MQQIRSPFLKYLQERGFINQITHIEELDELLTKRKISAYIGFDCTAKTLHIGSLIQIMILRALQKFGHQPIVLLGGGTTKIGDPSGKDESRQLLDEKQISNNLAGIKDTLSKFDLSNENSSFSSFKFVNNDDWLCDVKYIDFLRNIGRHFSVNKMLSFDSVKLRLDRQQPLSFLEFNYMILQSYDFYELNKKYNCILQIGGSDQWGNIVNGVDLVRRISALNHDNNVSFGLTTPLLTTADGKKMGKTANGAIWLDKEMLKVFDYFQFFRNIDDCDINKFFKLFTEIDLKEIDSITKENVNKQKEILAYEITKICHGKNNADEALNQAKNMFSNKIDIDLLPEKSIEFDLKERNEGKKLAEILRQANLCQSIGEARRLIKGGGVRIDDKKIDDENFIIQIKSNEFPSNYKISLGKKKIYKLSIK